MHLEDFYRFMLVSLHILLSISLRSVNEEKRGNVNEKEMEKDNVMSERSEPSQAR